MTWFRVHPVFWVLLQVFSMKPAGLSRLKTTDYERISSMHKREEEKKNTFSFTFHSLSHSLKRFKMKTKTFSTTTFQEHLKIKGTSVLLKPESTMNNQKAWIIFSIKWLNNTLSYRLIMQSEGFIKRISMQLSRGPKV